MNTYTDTITVDTSGVYSEVPAAQRRSKSFRAALAYALAQGQAGQWASDHYAETDHFTGWNYVAIQALMWQAARATVHVFDDRGDRKGQRLRRMELRKSFGSLRRAIDAGQLDEKDRPLGDEHPLVRLLNRPNPTESGASYRSRKIQQLRITGSVLVWKVPNRAGTRTVEKYVIPTAITSPVSPNRDLPRGGYRVTPRGNWSQYTDGDGFVETRGYAAVMGKVIPVERLLVIRLPHALFADDGQSPISAGALWTDSSDEMDRSRFAQFKNGANPSIHITAPENTDPTDEELDAIAERINQKYAGSDKSGKVLVTGPGTGAVPLSVSPRDMDYLGGFEQLRNSILALHSTPPVAVGLQEPGAYAAYYASLRQFLDLGVQPHLDLMADEETEQIARAEYGSSLTVEYEAASIDDPELLRQGLWLLARSSAITVDQLRAALGYEPWGDTAGQQPVSVASGRASTRDSGDSGADQTQSVGGFANLGDASSSFGKSAAIKGNGTEWVAEVLSQYTELRRKQAAAPSISRNGHSINGHR